jgi:hypothetical protein
MSAHRGCSFCGKLEGGVIRLIAGGGRQPNGELPPVTICNECVNLCRQILDREQQGPASVRWSSLLHRGENFEWTLVSQPDQSFAAVVRRVGSESSVGGVFPAGKTVATRDIQQLIDQLYDKL